jgi:hypothetical protein
MPHHIVSSAIDDRACGQSLTDSHRADDLLDSDSRVFRAMQQCVCPYIAIPSAALIVLAVVFSVGGAYA